MANILEELNLSYVRLYSEQPSLDDVFLAYTGERTSRFMKTFLKLFTYLSKDALKDFSFSFWVLLYPIILISLYFVSFSGIMEQDMGTVRVAMTADNPYHQVFEQAGDYFRDYRCRVRGSRESTRYRG